VTEESDFERAWQGKLAHGLDAVVGSRVRQEIMAGGERLSMESSRREVIAWSQGVMAKLDLLVAAPERRAIMTGCSCRYSEQQLQVLSEVYAETGDIDAVLAALQEQFVSLLRDRLQLSEEMIAEVLRRGWGAAGVRHGNRIVVTKIPKSGHLEAYLQETDPERRRQLYCHCPRVREAVQMQATLSPIYCYCGAGFYKQMWERILQTKVTVEVLHSVLQGDQVCCFVIHLPRAVKTAA
jgi:hypothetical protein